MTAVGTTVHDFDATTIDGQSISFDRYRGHVLLIVNVASRCGYTPQYRGLEALYRKYRDRGLVVIGFPCDQFGRQEPGTNAEIREFCSSHYDVTFPMFSKIDVNGDGAHPLYKFMKPKRKGLLGSEGIKWNFTKFLVGPSGEVLRRYGPAETPARIEADVIRTLFELSRPGVPERHEQ